MEDPATVAYRARVRQQKTDKTRAKRQLKALRKRANLTPSGQPTHPAIQTQLHTPARAALAGRRS